jgi:hypothetical protein
MNQNSAMFMYLKNHVSQDKWCWNRVIEGVFVEPQIREWIQDVKFEDQLRAVGREAWKSFKNVTTIFFGGGGGGGDYKGENYRDMVADLVHPANLRLLIRL